MTRPREFTAERLDWLPWIETVADIGLSDEQLEAVYTQAPNVKGSPYFATLALDLPALVQRTGLFNSTVRSPGGGSSADRELAATVTSVRNGCIYCTSVHAQRYVQYARRPDVIAALFADGAEARLDDPRAQAIADFSLRITDDPADLAHDDLQDMRDAGFSELEIYDIAQAAAMFAWANRLMQTLGEPVLPDEAGVSSP
jgi:uncharacterized peroxidase-related enzyme